jgi:hypothetical protein
MGEGQNFPAPTGGFFIPTELQFSRGQLNFDQLLFQRIWSTHPYKNWGGGGGGEGFPSIIDDLKWMDANS